MDNSSLSICHRVAVLVSSLAVSSECARCYGYTLTIETTPPNQQTKTNDSHNHGQNVTHSHVHFSIIIIIILFHRQSFFWVIKFGGGCGLFVGVAIWGQRSSSVGGGDCCERLQKPDLE